AVVDDDQHLPGLRRADLVVRALAALLCEIVCLAGERGGLRAVDLAAREDGADGDREGEGERERGERRGEQTPAQASHAETALYPVPRSVRIRSGRPSFRRSCATWTSTVRVPPGYSCPQTRSRSRSRETTTPAFAMKNASRSNSFAVSST